MIQSHYCLAWILQVNTLITYLFRLFLFICLYTVYNVALEVEECTVFFFKDVVVKSRIMSDLTNTVAQTNIYMGPIPRNEKKKKNQCAD